LSQDPIGYFELRGGAQGAFGDERGSFVIGGLGDLAARRDHWLSFCGNIIAK
jgi:hypothetical protein